MFTKIDEKSSVRCCACSGYEEKSYWSKSKMVMDGGDFLGMVTGNAAALGWNLLGLLFFFCECANLQHQRINVRRIR